MGEFWRFKQLMLLPIVVALDTSGSMSAELLRAVAQELRGIAAQAGEATLIVADSKIHEVVALEELENWIASARPKGGGVTDHRPVSATSRSIACSRTSSSDSPTSKRPCRLPHPSIPSSGSSRKSTAKRRGGRCSPRKRIPAPPKVGRALQIDGEGVCKI